VNPLDLDGYDFNVPEQLVAQKAISDRKSARLMIQERDGAIKHLSVRDLVSALPANSLVIVNDTKVIPARILGVDPLIGKFEILLCEMIKQDAQKSVWTAIGKPLRKLRGDACIQAMDGSRIQVSVDERQNADSPPLRVEMPFNFEGTLDWLNENAVVPLPPYIKRIEPAKAFLSEDRERYQTVYAQSHGSVAAPTAGLHFDEALLEEMRRADIKIVNVTLHVGLGTFLPIKAQNLGDHKMHSERFYVPKQTVTEMEKAKRDGREIVCVGTTSFRSIESLYKMSGEDRDILTYCDQWQATKLFVHPCDGVKKYTPVSGVTGLMTNFHQPKSTLFALICALLGVDEARNVYDTAIEQKYRFYSYGDSSLLWL
jgi:S-adenosylmethionine:tRNA ribosyltransferase-isomerase